MFHTNLQNVDVFFMKKYWRLKSCQRKSFADMLYKTICHSDYKKYYQQLPKWILNEFFNRRSFRRLNDRETTKLSYLVSFPSVESIKNKLLYIFLCLILLFHPDENSDTVYGTISNETKSSLNYQCLNRICPW